MHRALSGIETRAKRDDLSPADLKALAPLWAESRGALQDRLGAGRAFRRRD